ncbi:hypothetical protein CPB85DRAFT_1258787 [Mucidula mucida]|nr:hypothetical protein CPB85DRAFT_1258787 [Mucidula mucida]
MPKMSQFRALQRYQTFIADWLCAIFFSVATGMQDADKVVEGVTSTDYRAVYDGIHKLVRSPYQTPFSLFYMTVFASRLHSESGSGLLEPADFGVAQVADKYLLVLRVIYLIALQTLGEDILFDAEELDIAHLKHLAEYKRMWEIVSDEIASPHTGSMDIDCNEWEMCLLDITRLRVFMPYYNGAALREMQAAIDDLLIYMEFTSPMGNALLSELHLSYHPDVSLCPLPLDFSIGRLSIPYHSGQWNPSQDPIVESGRCRTRNIAPGSAQAVYNLDGTSSNPMCLTRLVHDFGVLTIYQPRPKRIIDVNLIEFEASSSRL